MVDGVLNLRDGMYDPMSFSCVANEHEFCFHTVHKNGQWCSCDCHDDVCMCNHHFYNRQKREREHRESLIKKLDSEIIDLLIEFPITKDRFPNTHDQDITYNLKLLHQKYFQLRATLGWGE